MKIEKNKVVAVTYDLTVDGKIVDRATEEAPLDYIQGMHMLIPAFEAALEGLQEGDAFAFTLQPEEGYGSYDDKKLIHLPPSAFTIQGEVRKDLMQVGRILPMVGALMDFNHPMAGKVLSFSGKVVSVREATEKELAEGLHGEFLPPEEHHCCHGKGHCHHHHDHGEGECCGHGEGHCHEHGDGECCGHGHCHHEEE